MVVRLEREDRQPGYLEFILLRRNTLRYSAYAPRYWVARPSAGR
jgi:hypothetical protein